MIMVILAVLVAGCTGNQTKTSPPAIVPTETIDTVPYQQITQNQYEGSYTSTYWGVEYTESESVYQYASDPINNTFLIYSTHRGDQRLFGPANPKLTALDQTVQQRLSNAYNTSITRETHIDEFEITNEALNRTTTIDKYAITIDLGQSVRISSYLLQGVFNHGGDRFIVAGTYPQSQDETEHDRILEMMRAIVVDD